MISLQHSPGSGLVALTTLAVCVSMAVPGCKSQPVAVPDDRALQIESTSGEMVEPMNIAAAAKVFVFILPDCPIANAYAPEINSIIKAYAARDAQFFMVHVDSDLTLEEAQRHASDYGYKCAVLLDRKHLLVKAMGATITPEAVVLDATNRVRYQGRINDRYVDFGKQRAVASQHDLRNALDAVLNDRRVAVERTRAIGCYIPGTSP